MPDDDKDKKKKLPFGPDAGGVIANIKKGMGLDPEEEAKRKAIDARLKKAGAFGY